MQPPCDFEISTADDSKSPVFAALSRNESVVEAHEDLQHQLFRCHPEAHYLFGIVGDHATDNRNRAVHNFDHRSDRRFQFSLRYSGALAGAPSSTTPSTSQVFTNCAS